jgi:hypothetical protein
MLAVLATWTLAGCTAAPRAGTATPPRPGAPEAAQTIDDTRGTDDSRGLELHGARLGFDHALLVQRPASSVPHELHDGDTVTTGDRIRASVQTSEDAYLYLAFCAHHELAVYPSGGIRIHAGQLTIVPTSGAELVFDEDPGLEVLYVILSRTELSAGAPTLLDALASRRPHGTPADCQSSAPMHASIAHDAGATTPPASLSTHVLRGELLHKMPMPSRRKRDRPGSSTATATGLGAGERTARVSRAPPQLAPPPVSPPVPDFERNPGDVVWYRADLAAGPLDVIAADPGGIAVVRHTFTHAP